MSWNLWIRQSHTLGVHRFHADSRRQLRVQGSSIGRASAMVDLLAAATALYTVGHRSVPVRGSVCHQATQQRARLTSYSSGRRTGAADFQR